MTPLFLDLLVQSGVLAAAAVGLSLQMRLVRFFDLSWALWAMTTALVGVYVARVYSSPLVGVLASACVGAAIGAVEDGLILRRALSSAGPREPLERISFAAALAVYLAVVSLADVLGFRDQQMMPPTGLTWFGMSVTSVTVAAFCWGAIGLLAVLRQSPVGIYIRALLDDPSVYVLFGFRLLPLTLFVGLLAGAITGIASGSFGLLYFAHHTTGLSLMLLAVIPFIATGMKGSLRLVMAAVLVTVAMSFVRFRFGYAASEFVVYGTILIVLALRPHGLRAFALREV